MISGVETSRQGWETSHSMNFFAYGKLVLSDPIKAFGHRSVACYTDNSMISFVYGILVLLGHVKASGHRPVAYNTENSMCFH